MRIPLSHRPVVALLLIGFVGGAVPAPAAAPAPAPARLPDSAAVLVEAEQFVFPGGWLATMDREALGDGLLIAPQARPDAAGPPGANLPALVPDAYTVVRVPRAAAYHVWARARDYAKDRPGIRRFRVTLDGQPLPDEAGRHGKEGYAWEKVGQVQLDAGEHMLGLRQVTAFARCDAVLLTDHPLDPNTRPVTALARFRTQPRPADWSFPDPPDAPGAEPAPKLDDAQVLAKLENESLRVEFLRPRGAAVGGGADRGGTPRYSVRAGDAWVTGPAGADRSALLFAPSLAVNFNECYPIWTGGSRPQTVRVRGKDYAVFDTKNPFRAAASADLVITDVRQVDPRTVEVRYASASAGGKPLPTAAPAPAAEVTARWTLADGARDVAVAFTITPAADGFYSLAYSAGPAPDRADPALRFALLPPLYQFLRLPPSPNLVPDSMTPHPLALAEYAATGAGQAAAAGAPQPQLVSLAVIADPDALPFKWATAHASRYGFSLLNATGHVQPSLFSPILGLDGSQWKAGTPRQVAFRVAAVAGDWRSALEYVSDKVMGVRDYRKPVNVSMSAAAANMVDLMRNADASGWSADLKGFWNIEQESTVTHSSPLGILSAAVLSGDEEFYRTRALPTLEFTLTRPTAFWTQPGKKVEHNANGQPRLTVPTKFYGTAYWQGVDALLGHLNPWVKDLAMDGGKPRGSRAYNSSPEWSEWLAAYRLTGDAKILQTVRAQADEFIAKSVLGPGNRPTPVPFSFFYNISFYPYWWDLIDLYDVTGDRKYLDAAEYGAFHTVAGQWSHPRVPEGTVTVHPEGQYEGTAHIWWKGDVRYRLGAPRRPNDTPAHAVPAWQVAQVGLGLEQPSTYFVRNKPMRNIMMSSWSPHLLRAHQHTGREIYRTYARNSAVGRFANYPGYYLMGYTDLPLAPDYVYKGPDVTSIYYHHIPVHFGWTVDFLVAQAEDRSGGRIKFPFVKQQNYAWFSNRVYGGDTGRVYGQSGARLFLAPKTVRVDDANVDCLTARTGDRVWLILMSQSDRAVEVTPAVDAALLQPAAAGNTLVYTGTTADPQTLPADAWKKVTVPPMGVVAVGIPVQSQAQPAAPRPVRDGHQLKDLGHEGGQLHAFRIRTPWGKDSVYVAVAGGPEAGATLDVRLLPGNANALPRPAHVTAFPYEATTYPLPGTGGIKVQCDFTPPGGQKQTVNFDFPG